MGRFDGTKIKTEKVEEDGSERVADEGWQTRMEETMPRLDANTVQQQEILLKLHDEAVTQREMMATQADKMTQAVETMMRMVVVVDQKILRVQQQRMPPKLHTELRQLTPGVTPEKPASSAQEMPSARKRKDSESTTSVPAKKDTPRPGEQKDKKDDEPKQSHTKVKTVSKKSGPTGDQSQN